MNKNIDSIILDVDGTLWDSTGVVADAWTAAIKAYDNTDMQITPEMLQRLFGRPMTEIAAALFPERSEEEQSKILELCCQYEHEAVEKNTRDICYSGVVDTIKELSKHVQICIVSNCQSGYIELFLEKTGLKDDVTDLECFGNTGKLKGENILSVIARNSLKSPVYVGDTQGDLDASQYAGIPFIYAAYGFGTCASCDMEIHEFAQLKTLLTYVDNVI